MEYYEVAPTRIARAGSDSFTYSSEVSLSIGQLVIVELGKKPQPGVVIKKVEKPSYPTKSISSIIEEQPLPPTLVQLCLWMSSYYATPLATVLQTVLPRGLIKTRRERPHSSRPSLRDRTHFLLTSDQQSAIDTVEKMSPGSALLHGVTGSGKTRVYIELAERAVANGTSVIVLVPEIALTSQLVDEFSHHFDNVILTHSRQTEAERHLAWKDALASTTPRIVVGPRSALFMPLQNIGLVIIDEAHEPSFKQEQAPRYSALRAASMIAAYNKAKVVLGSATPLISDYYLAEHSDRPIIRMNERANKNAAKSDITLVDLTKKSEFKHHRFLSDKLIARLNETFVSGKQALIFHNRRGSASTTLCDNCGWTAQCPRCFVPFTLHADKHSLECHICGNKERVPTSCPECGNASILHKGIGTKLIESELRKLFPNKVIVRFDADTLAEDSVDKRYKDLYEGTIDLMIGTQVIAKGLDLPHLRTVGIIQADAGLSLPDYGSTERTFQLLAQVVGRVGRSEHPTSVIIQSYQPTHPAVVDGIKQDYQNFYTSALAERRRAHFPPYAFLLQLTCVYKTEAAAIRNAQILSRTLRQKAGPEVEILGPTPAFYERQHDTYRWQLLVKSPKRVELVELLRHVPPTHWQAELDPISLL
jgi:primosomal protein N' (replication factor Y) (superfamily II helicase)